MDRLGFNRRGTNRLALLRRLSCATAVTGAVLAAVPLSAAAAPSVAPGQRTSSNTAVVRGAHFSPDTPGVDVYLTAYSGGSSAFWLSDLGYGDVSGYRRVKPGLYLISMRAHGAARSSPAGLKWMLDAKPGAAYTVAAVGMNSQLKGIVLSDKLNTPRAGHGRVRVIQAASRAPSIKLTAQPDVVVAGDARFGTSTAYASVPAGRWVLKASVPSGTLSTTRTVAVQSGSVDSIIVLDAKGKGIELRAVHDASGSSVAPLGSVDAGAGGTASAAHPSPSSGSRLVAVEVSVAVGLAAFGMLALSLLRRRAR